MRKNRNVSQAHRKKKTAKSRHQGKRKWRAGPQSQSIKNVKKHCANSQCRPFLGRHYWPKLTHVEAEQLSRLITTKRMRSVFNSLQRAREVAPCTVRVHTLDIRSSGMVVHPQFQHKAGRDRGSLEDIAEAGYSSQWGLSSSENPFPKYKVETDWGRPLASTFGLHIRTHTCTCITPTPQPHTYLCNKSV